MLVKLAIKTAIATALVGAISQEANFVEHPVYLAMGLINTMQPSLGPTVKKAWGRLAGSAIGGIIGAWLVLTLGTSPITSGLAFVLATLVCELFQFQAPYSQAGTLAALVAAQVMGAGNPAEYAFSRVLDNWIGVVIGIGVTLIFWPDNPRKTLSDSLVRVLNNTEQLFQSLVASARSGTNQSTLESQLINDLSISIQKSKSVLSQEIYGIVGSKLTQENWSSLLALEDRIHRHLSMMLKLLQSPSELSLQFAEPLKLLVERISHTCRALAEIVQSIDLINSNSFRFWVFAPERKLFADPEIQFVKESLQSMIDQLSKMRSTGITARYSLLEIRQFYEFLHHLNRFVQVLEQLTIALVNREKIAMQPEAAFRLSWHPVPSHRVFHILKTGFAVWLTLVLLNDWLKLPFNYYAIIAVVVAMQPTFGKGIVAGTQRVIVTGIGAIYALLLINTLGSTPLTLAVGVALTILTSSYLGLAQGYATGCVLIILSILSHSNDPNGYIGARFLETLIGTIIALILSELFWPSTSSQQLDQGIAQTFNKMGSLYIRLVNIYLQETESEEENAQLSKEIQKSLKSHDALQKETQQEAVYNLMAPKAQRKWNLLLSYEKELFKNLEALQDAVQQGTATQFPKELRDAVQASAEATRLSFNQLAKATQQMPTQQKVSSPLSTFDAIERALLNMRATGVGLSYSLDQVLSLRAVISAMKDTAGNLHQVAIDTRPFRKRGIL